MMADLVLTNVKACTPNAIMDCSIAIDEGRIVKIGKETNMPKSDARLNLQNLLVLPGLIDAHVHLRDEGKSYKEDFFSGTAAAATGGITTVLDMPNNDPVTMSVETFRNRVEIAERKVLVNVGFFSEFPNNLAEIAGIVKEGAAGFKLYMAEQIGGLDIKNDEALEEAFRTVGNMKFTTAVHAEDEQTLKRNEDQLKSVGRNNIDAFLEAHSETVEVKAIDRLLRHAEATGMHLHFCHVSTEAGLNRIVERKKSSQMPITCEATPHHLLLSDSEMRRIGMLAVCMPPIRGRNDVEGLWSKLENGWVDIIGSDHAPHALKEKEAESVWKVKAGFPGLETTLPLLLTEINRGRILIGDVVRLMSENPAKIFKLKNKGALKEGNDADLTVVDLKANHKIDASEFQSKAKFSPFDGREVKGKPVKTFIAGQLVMDNNDIVVKEGTGRIVRRE